MQTEFIRWFTTLFLQLSQLINQIFFLASKTQGLLGRVSKLGPPRKPIGFIPSNKTKHFHGIFWRNTHLVLKKLNIYRNFGELIFCSLFFRDSAKCALSISARDDGVVSIEAFYVLDIDTWYIPRTQMTLVLIGKGLVLVGCWPSKIEVIWVPGT